MKIFYLFFFLLMHICSVAQKVTNSPVNNRTNIHIKGRNNIVKVIQTGELFQYNLESDDDFKKLVDLLMSNNFFKKNFIKIENDISSLKKQTDIISKIIQNSVSPEGYISIEDYTINIEKYIFENKKLKDQIAQSQSHINDTNFKFILNNAEKKLKNYDNEGYQNILEDFKQIKKKVLHEAKYEIAQAAYFQAENNFQRFQYDKALEQINEALNIDSLNAFYQLSKGMILFGLTDFKKSIEILSLIDKSKVNDTLKGGIHNNLGLSYRAIGDFNNAIINLKEAYSIWNRILNTDHIGLSNVSNNLGLAYINLGEYDSALHFLQISLTKRLNLLGVKNNYVATSYNNIGAAYLSKKNYDRALIYFDKALSILLEIFGRVHPDVAMAYVNIGMLYVEKGDYDTGISYFNQGLKIELSIFDPNHVTLATTYSNLGLAYSYKKLPQDALEYFRKALSIYINKFGENNYSVAVTWNNIGGAYDESYDFETAIQYYNKALSILIPILGNSHPNVFMTFGSLGKSYISIGKKKLGYQTLKKNAEFLNLPFDLKMDYLNTIGIEYSLNQKFNVANNFFELVIEEMKKQHFHKPDKLWVAAYANIARSQCILGNRRKAKLYRNKAIKEYNGFNDKSIYHFIIESPTNCTLK